MRADEVMPVQEPRLQAYVGQAATALAKDGIWTQETADAVLAR